MNLVLEAAAPFQRRTRPIWPDVLAWLICGLAGLHTAPLHAVTDVPTQEALLVRLHSRVRIGPTLRYGLFAHSPAIVRS